MEKRKVPAVRFKGFEDDWEQRKVGELTEELTEYANLSSGLPLLTSSRNGIMYQNDYRGNQTTDSDQTLFSIVPFESCTYRHMSDDNVFHLNINRLEKGLVSREYPVFYASGKNNLDFIVQYLNSSQQFRSFCTEQKKGGTRTRLYYKNLCAFEMLVPSSVEQQKIADYLMRMDNLITLHQRKLEKLYSVKKSMLEKMFPKNDSKIPEIRFEGFTDDWEQRKLGEILQERDVRTSDFKNNPLYSLTIENGITPKTDRYERSSLVTKTEDLFKVVKPNEFVTNPMNLRFGALGYNTNAFNVSVSGYYDVFSIDADKCSGFWNSYFKTPGSMKIFDNAATGSLIEKRRVKYSTLQELDFFMPKQIEEKILIGRYMDSLDHLITLHQRKLEKMKSIKKSLLEKLFVQ